MKKFLFPFLLGLLCLVVPGGVRADIILVAYMDGADEVPPNDSPATGIAVLELNDTLDQLNYYVAFENMDANAISAHIHFADPGSSGPIIFGFPGVPSATAGSFTGSFTANDFIPVAGLDTYREAIHALLDGHGYVNVHSTMFPGGEIHGQVYIFAF
jgi:hypothetical protein